MGDLQPVCPLPQAAPLWNTGARLTRLLRPAYEKKENFRAAAGLLQAAQSSAARRPGGLFAELDQNAAGVLRMEEHGFLAIRRADDQMDPLL